MKKTSLIFLLAGVLVLAACKKSALPSETASAIKTYDFNTSSGINTNDHGFLVVCSENFNLNQVNDLLVKFNANGGIDWQYKFNPKFVNDSSFNLVNIMDFTQTTDGYSVFAMLDSVVPNKSGIQTFYSPAFFLFSASGELTYTRKFPFIHIFTQVPIQLGGNIIQLKNGNYIVGFNTPSPFGTDTVQFRVAKLSGQGAILSDTIDIAGLNFPHYLGINIFKMLELPNGNIMLAGTNSYAGILDTNLRFKAQKEFVTPNGYYINYFVNIVPQNGYYLLTGFADIGTLSLFHYNYLLTIVDENLSVKPGLNVKPGTMAKTVGTPKQDYCLSSIATNDNNFALIGVSNYESNTLNDYASSILYIKVDANGNELATQTLGTGLGTGGLLISQNPDNSYNVLGTKLAYAGNPNFYQTVFIHTTLP